MDKKALCRGRDGAELTLVVWPEGLSPQHPTGLLGGGGLSSLCSAFVSSTPALPGHWICAKPCVCFSLFPLSAGRKGGSVPSEDRADQGLVSLWGPT